MLEKGKDVLEQISNTSQPKCCYKCADVFQRMSWMILCPICDTAGVDPTKHAHS